MIVECPACATIFPVDPKKVPTAGIRARCSVCSEVFFVIVSSQDTVEPEPPDVSPVRALPESDAAAEASVEAPGPESVEGEEPETARSEEEVGRPDEADVPPAEEGFAETVSEEEAPLEAPPVAAPAFGKRDPMEKAQRLARVLVSDIILYNPDRHQSATETGRVKEEFQEEIQKSWAEYVEQVGEEVAESTPFFTDALNEILGKGETVF